VSASIAEQILANITSGVFAAGSRLPTEAELAKDFEVSRPSVREALAALQFAGHLESRRGFGTVVVDRAPSTADERPAQRPLQNLREAVDLLETRLLVEPYAIAAAAADPDRGALRSASRLIDGMRVAVDDPTLRASTDILVHRALIRVCRNEVLRLTATSLVELCVDPLFSKARIKAWSSPDLPREWADQHAVVRDAIANGDTLAARAGSLAHLASVVDNLAAATRHNPTLRLRMSILKGHVAAPQHPSTRVTPLDIDERDGSRR